MYIRYYVLKMTTVSGIVNIVIPIVQQNCSKEIKLAYISKRMETINDTNNHRLISDKKINQFSDVMVHSGRSRMFQRVVSHKTASRVGMLIFSEAFSKLMYVNYDTSMLTERKHDVERDINENV